MEKKPFLTESMAQDIIQDVPTPFHVYDEKGIRENARRINKAFSWNKGFKEYFAVKATPNPQILKLLREEGIAHFAVEEAEDVTRLRQAGFAQEPILMLRSTTNRDELVELLNQRAICTIGSYETGTALNAVAEELGVKAEAHVLMEADAVVR